MDRRWCAGLVVLSLGVCTSVGYWIANAAISARMASVVGGLGVLALALLWGEALRSVPGTLLARDGRWFWRGVRGTAETPVRVEVVLDTGGWLLLSYAPFQNYGTREGGRRWFAVSRRQGLASLREWHRLRCLLGRTRATARLPDGGAAA